MLEQLIDPVRVPNPKMMKRAKQRHKIRAKKERKVYLFEDAISHGSKNSSHEEKKRKRAKSLHFEDVDKSESSDNSNSGIQTQVKDIDVQSVDHPQRKVSFPVIKDNLSDDDKESILKRIQKERERTKSKRAR